MKITNAYLKYFYLVVFLITTAFIFIFAGFSGEQSSSQSGFLLNLISSLLDALQIHLNQEQLDTVHIVIRKLIGHFVIFGLDGIFAYLTFDSWLKYSKKAKIAISLGVGILIASLSEVIQLLAPERGPSIYDVLLDYSGFILGVIFVLLIGRLNRVSSLKKVKQ